MIAGCCFVLILLMSVPATKTLSFRDADLPSANQPPYSSTYQLNLIKGGAKNGEPGVATNAEEFIGLNKTAAPQRNQFTELTAHTIKLTQEQPASTFSIDVDTASYSFLRTMLNKNVHPAKDAIRIEELM